jgi:hypothetical protein
LGATFAWRADGARLPKPVRALAPGAKNSLRCGTPTTSPYARSDNELLAPVRRHHRLTGRPDISTHLVPFWYYGFMPALNITFTDDEMTAIREAAASANTSLKAYAHDLITDATNGHRRRVLDAAKLVAERSAELNRRLA